MYQDPHSRLCQYTVLLRRMGLHPGDRAHLPRLDIQRLAELGRTGPGCLRCPRRHRHLPSRMGSGVGHAWRRRGDYGPGSDLRPSRGRRGQVARWAAAEDGGATRERHAAAGSHPVRAGGEGRCSGLHSSAVGRALIGLNRLTLAETIRGIRLTLDDFERRLGGTDLHLSVPAHVL